MSGAKDSKGLQRPSSRGVLRRCPLLVPLAGLAAGSLAAGTAGLFLTQTETLLLSTAAVLLLLLRRSFLLIIALSLLLFCHGNHGVGLLLAPLADPAQIANRAGERLTVEGTVARRPQLDAGGGGRILLEVTAAGSGMPLKETSGRLMVRAGEGGFDVRTGDLVRLEGKVRRPRPLGLPGEFDYRRHLAFDGVYATLYLQQAQDVALISPAVDHGVMRTMDRVSAWCGRTVRQAVEGTNGAILVAILNGDRSGIPSSWEEIYTRAGVNHILSISGFHIGVVTLVICQFLFLLLGRSERLLLHYNLRRLVPLLALPPVVLYLLVSGSALATVRSVLMAGICALTLVLDQETDPVNSLALAALAILVAAPQAIYDISFQLSFLALWGILLSLPLVQEGPMARIPYRPLRWTAALVIASLAATLATAVPVALTFHRASFAGILSNLVAIPLIGYGGVALGFAGLLLSVPFLSMGSWLLKGAGLCIGAAGWFMELCARIPPIHWVARWHDLLAAVILLLLWTLLRGRGRLVALSLTFMAWGLLLLPLRRSEDGLVLHFLSVGQGESTLVVEPSGETMLVDCGGVYGPGGERFGRRVLVPALETLGLERIDRLVLTHSHPDHMGGAEAVLERFAVGEFWSADTGSPDGLERLRPLLAARGVAMRRFSAASPAEFLGSCRIEFLAPLHPPVGEANEDSLVFRLTWGDWHTLFTGDIGGVTEERLLSRGAPVASHLLKVGHHGSRHSSTPRFLAAVDPQQVVISAGYQNIFRLPAAETLGRLEKQGVRVHRTDLDGTVTVFFRHDTMDVMGYNESRLSLWGGWR